MPAHYVTTNLNDVKDLAPEFGMSEMGEARFARETLGAERIGMSLYRMNPGKRVGFGHCHTQSEEMYVVISGSGRFKVEDDILAVGEKDVVYCPPASVREWEAGPEGLELLAFGGHAENESEMKPGWWTD
jgi:mannose-6-phosphate isomerase-like protein (cupin superfamily)